VKYDAARAQVQAMEAVRNQRARSHEEEQCHGRAIIELIEIETALKLGK
jgi:hypothetical protein